MHRAAIDIGSNSLLLTIVDAGGRVVHDEVHVVGLGRGLGERGVMAPDRLQAAEKVLEAYAATARTFGVEPWSVRAVATSAARRALNAETFFARIQRDIGLRVRIVSGEEEALLTWRGALVDLADPTPPLLVVDLGGGSTELVQGDAAHLRARVSLEIGSIRLTERFLGVKGAVPDRFDPDGISAMADHVRIEVGRVALSEVATVIGVAGTVTTLAAMALDLAAYDSARVHGSRLSTATLRRQAAALASADRAGRLALARPSPERADYLQIGRASCRERV